MVYVFLLIANILLKTSEKLLYTGQKWYAIEEFLAKKYGKFQQEFNV